jgi:hypothetical protein
LTAPLKRALYSTPFLGRVTFACFRNYNEKRFKMQPYAKSPAFSPGFWHKQITPQIVLRRYKNLRQKLTLMPDSSFF